MSGAMIGTGPWIGATYAGSRPLQWLTSLALHVSSADQQPVPAGGRCNWMTVLVVDVSLVGSLYRVSMAGWWISVGTSGSQCSVKDIKKHALK